MQVMGVIHGNILPQGGQLQNYLKLDLGEFENHLWAHVESKSSKKKK